MKDDELAEFIGDDGHFSTMFDFSAHTLAQGESGWNNSRKPSLKEWRDTIFASQKRMQEVGFPANIIENHDEPRGASRFLPEYAQNETGKKMLATTSVFLYGIPFIYQGQEIGMTNCRRNDISEYDDISTKDQYREALAAGCSREQALEYCYENSRDNARTPMQWSDEKGAGFTIGTPWLALNPNYTEINVENQAERPDSVLSYYKKLLALKKSPEYKDTFTYGRFVPDYEDKEGVFAYHRISGNDTEKACVRGMEVEDGEKDVSQDILIAANYGTELCTLKLAGRSGKVLLSNAGKEEKGTREITEAGSITLESCEAAVILL